MPIMCFHQTYPVPSPPVPSCFCHCSFLSTSHHLFPDPSPPVYSVLSVYMGEEHLLQPGRPPRAASPKKPAFLPLTINCLKLLSQGQGLMGPSRICIRILVGLILCTQSQLLLAPEYSHPVLPCLENSLSAVTPTSSSHSTSSSKMVPLP